MKNLNIVWDEKSLDAFITAPQKPLPKALKSPPTFWLGGCDFCIWRTSRNHGLQFRSGLRLPGPSPFVMKVDTLLKIAKLWYRTDTTGFANVPTRQSYP